MSILSNVKTAYQDMKTARLFKKHNVSTWSEYNLKFDRDYNKRANTIRTLFHGYPFIAEIDDVSALLTNTCDNWEAGSCISEDGYLQNAEAKLEQRSPTLSVLNIYITTEPNL